MCHHTVACFQKYECLIIMIKVTGYYLEPETKGGRAGKYILWHDTNNLSSSNQTCNVYVNGTWKVLLKKSILPLKKIYKTTQ